MGGTPMRSGQRVRFTPTKSRSRRYRRGEDGFIFRCHNCHHNHTQVLTCSGKLLRKDNRCTYKYKKCANNYCHDCLRRVYHFQEEELENPDPAWICLCCRNKCLNKPCRSRVMERTLEERAELKKPADRVVIDLEEDEDEEEEEGEGEGEGEDEEAGFEDLSNQESDGDRLVDRLRTEVTKLEAELVNEKLKNEEMEIEMSQLKLKNEEMEIEISQLKRERDLALELVYIRRKSLKG